MSYHTTQAYSFTYNYFSKPIPTLHLQKCLFLQSRKIVVRNCCGRNIQGQQLILDCYETPYGQIDRAHVNVVPTVVVQQHDAASWLTGALLRHGPFTSGADPNNYQPMHGLQAQLQSALHLPASNCWHGSPPVRPDWSRQRELRVRIRTTPRADARELVSLVLEKGQIECRGKDGENHENIDCRH